MTNKYLEKIASYQEQYEVMKKDKPGYIGTSIRNVAGTVGAAVAGGAAGSILGLSAAALAKDPIIKTVVPMASGILGATGAGLTAEHALFRKQERDMTGKNSSHLRTAGHQLLGRFTGNLYSLKRYSDQNSERKKVLAALDKK